MESLSQRDKKVIWHPYTQFSESIPEIAVNSAKDAVLIDENGKSYIDAISSWWVNTHGHCNSHITAAVKSQVDVLEHSIFAGFTHEPAIRLAERLLKHLPAEHSRIFFSDNGSTAVEVAIKIALQYWKNNSEERKTIVAFKNAYHGDTFGSMSVSARSVFTEAFSDFLFDVVFIDLPVKGNEENTIKQLNNCIAEYNPAAFIFEPLIQGAAGMIMYEAEILNKLIDVCKESSIITIADEVMTGFFRTGTFFASDQLISKPDIYCLSKGITGGFMALGATSCAEYIFNSFVSNDKTKTLYHGHSYTANPLACSAANASLDLYENPDCEKNVKRISKRHKDFIAELFGNPKIKEVRQKGTILAIEISTTQGTSYLSELRNIIYDFFISYGILLRPLGNIIYVLPPYCITDRELDYIYIKIKDFLNQLSIIKNE